jgi:hypothetical protein
VRGHPYLGRAAFRGRLPAPGHLPRIQQGLIRPPDAWYTFEPERFAADPLTRSTYALHFYDSVLVIEKRPIPQPQQSLTGKPSF